MKKQSLRLTIALLTAFASPLLAENKAGQFFGSVDYFLAGDVADDIEKDNNDAASEMTNSGDPTTSSTDVGNGIGGRIGYLRNLSPNFSLGGSVGYIAGPKIESNLTFLPGGISGIQGYVNSTIKTHYVRFLAEGVAKYPLNEKATLNLGLGLGVANAETTQEFSGYLTDGISSVSDSDESDESTTGFTWEVSPSISFNFEKVALSLGLRYAQFPKIKETDETMEIDWKALGFFAGIQF